MSYTAIGILSFWAIAGLPLWGLCLNDIRVIHNHIAPSASDMRYLKPGSWFWTWSGFYFTAMDPAKLTEPGRDHLRLAIRHEWMLWGWMVGSAPIIVAIAMLS
ncbi:hypothetical protein [Bradyrhizobium sp. SRS-191]|uniref:hypothetical protein n=1 Tax=Bradyrhizobium sp. SRS-191 TaxID=2962606 RepID=UPI00211EAFC2|nr:hypothetical protein [Bradyrhizobium sp. SRS-191]